jgi:hypothetical protein
VKIVVLDSTSIPGVKSGPGSPAYFSRFAIEYLTQQLKHEVTIADSFDPGLCAAADVVWAEWITEPAYQAAASGVCKRLVLRCKGFDAHGPLDQLRWNNVDALVYESPHVRRLAEVRFPALADFKPTHVVLSGIDLTAIPFKERQAGKVIALVGRAVADKGYQIAYEWAREKPLFEFHMTCSLAEANPRFMGYLEHAKPPNVTLHGTVADPVKWLQEIDANYFLSCSIQEAPGYAIAEAMALGIKPLIYDGPGISDHWPLYLTWHSFDELNRMMVMPHDSALYRRIVENQFDAAKLSKDFAAILLSGPARDITAAVQVTAQQVETETVAVVDHVFGTIHRAVDDPNYPMDKLDAAITDFRSQLEVHGEDAELRYGSALGTAVAFYNHGDLARAEMWACRALLDFARPDVLVLLGEIATGRGDKPGAVQWFKAACAVDDVPHPHRNVGLTERRWVRLEEVLK